MLKLDDNSVTISADKDPENPSRPNTAWTVNGKRMSNGQVVELSPGQRVKFQFKSGKHGLLFRDKATAEAMFDIDNSPDSSKFVLNPNPGVVCSTPTSYGTRPQESDSTAIAELVVKQAITLAQPGEWMSSQSCGAMQGLFVPADTTLIVADPDRMRWLVNNVPLTNSAPIALEPGKKIRFSTLA
jgi:hypothetical protein